jgi:DNA invertase Pin-like site-specific DNA recombinase
MKAPLVKPVRCAIYTRVSTEHGLDQEFNSLDAQYEAASAYIKSQAHAGWTLIRSRYDDGGYSGGSTERPDLQKLLNDIRARKIDVIVVYKVDRLTRSLADFAKLVELFDAHGVSFVSVTQQFNTTTSMGRLTLNVLLSFAQFEREVTSERIRDKIAASKRKGIWVGGTLPLGYEMRDGKIAIVEEEAELVRSIYRRYLELGGVNELLRDLRDRNIRTKSRLLSTGATRGGIPFGRGALYYLDALWINRIVAHDLAGDARDKRGPASVALLVGCAKPVPAFRRVGVAALCRIDHEARLLFCDEVHSRTGGEIIRRLSAAVKHHDQGKRLPLIAARDEELVGTTSRRVAVGAIAELSTLRYDVRRRWRGALHASHSEPGAILCAIE